jgi:hypothetical protein
VPVAAGVNVTLKVQFFPDATLVPQVFHRSKSPLLAPVTAIPLMVSAAVAPVFVSVRFCGLLAVPTVWLVNVRLVGDRLTVVTTPVPVRLTVCVVPPPLSLTVTAASRVPAAVGVKVTVIVQCAPAATLVPQMFVWLKSCALKPVTVMLLIVNAVVPTFAKVMTCAPLGAPTSWLPKVRLEGVNWTRVPVPVRDTVCGAPGALSLTERLAVRDPFAVGANVTLIVQLAPAATLDPHVFVWLKSDGLAPVSAIFVTLRASFPVFVRVAFWGELLTCSV